MDTRIMRCCEHCSAELEDDALFCPSCGYPVDLWPDVQKPVEQKTVFKPKEKKHWLKKAPVAGWKKPVITVTAIVLLLALAVTLVGNYFAISGGPLRQMTTAINHTIRAESFTLDITTEYDGFGTAYESNYVQYDLKDEAFLLWQTASSQNGYNSTLAICDGYQARRSDSGSYYTDNAQAEISKLFEVYRQTASMNFKKADWQGLLDNLQRGLYRTLARKLDMELAEKDMQKLIKNMNSKKWMKENAGYSCKWKNGVMTHTLRIDPYTFLMACLECFEDAFYIRSDYYAIQDDFEDELWNEGRIDISLSVQNGKLSAFTYTSEAGMQTVTVQYLGKTTTYTVRVKEPELVSIAIGEYPGATLEVGDPVDTGAVVILAQYEDGSVVDDIRTGFTCEPTAFQSAGTQSVTVTYQGKTATFPVTVASTASYTVQLSASNSAYGTVSGGGSYQQGQDVTIQASAASGCRFLMWSDGETAASRTIHADRNISLTAMFYGPVSEKWVDASHVPGGALVTEEQTQYRYRELQTTTANTPSLSGWTCTGSSRSWSDWSSTQQTSAKPTESDTLRIVGTSVSRYAYYHYCNRYSDGSTGVDSCDVDGSGRRHTLYTDSELPSMYINTDHGGRESEVKGGCGAAGGCSWNYYAWWRDPANDDCTYSYQTRSEITTYTFSRYSDWSSWSLSNPGQSSTREVETRIVYRYRPQ